MTKKERVEGIAWNFNWPCKITKTQDRVFFKSEGIDEDESLKYTSRKGIWICSIKEWLVLFRIKLRLVLDGVKLVLVLVGIKLGLIFVGVKLGLAN